jgi:ribosomal protein S18 acetylase RimI-like enzyme
MLRVVPAAGSRLIAALNILYQTASPEERSAQVAESVQESADGELDLSHLLLAEYQDRPVGALLLRMQPNAIAFLWPPVVSVDVDEPSFSKTPITKQADLAPEAIEDALLQTAVQGLDRTQTRLSQSLLELHQSREQAALSRHGFQRLTDLTFFEHRPVKNRRATKYVAPERNSRLTHFVYRRSRNRLRFANVIEQTYHGSLDCPEMNGFRTANQSLQVYAASGPVVPDLWRVYRQEDQDIGVILVVGRPEQKTWEVIYLGVVESARRQGIAKAMLIDVINAARDAQVERLLIVVDSRNRPAIRLYESLDFTPFDARAAYVRQNRTTPQSTITEFKRST